ncbi:MAG: phosphatase PAP2 family protein [Spirochaetales bacterium]|nr:phosphatase PAP2 family protein [Spirochaetales bacterium]
MMRFFEYLEQGPGLDVTAWFHQGGETILYWLLMPFHWLGSEAAALLILPIVYWSLNKDLGKKLLKVTLLSQALSLGMKYWGSRPRPFHVKPERFTPIHEYAEPGWPSGHTIFGTSLGLCAASFTRNKGVKLFWAFFIIIMGLSRLVHGVHYPQDVLTGWLVGFLAYWAVISLDRQICHRTQSWSWKTKIFVQLGLLLIVLVGVSVLPLKLEVVKGLLATLATLLGAMLGWTLEPQWAPYSTNTIPLKHRILRSIFGLILLAGIHLGVRWMYYAFAEELSFFWARLFYGGRYAFIGFVATLGVPLLFRVLKLSSVQNPAQGESGAKSS